MACPCRRESSGSLNELFDPSVVDRIEFQTGGWDAEFGNKNAAIVDVRTRIPTGGFHMSLDGFAGSFKTDGQGLNLSDNVGKWGFFLSGSRQETGMRQEPVMFDTTNLKPLNFHNSGQDYFSFGKLQFTPSDRDVFDLEGNWSRTHFLVPFDSTQGFVDDRQTDINSFANLGWRHRFGDLDSANASSGELFTGFYYRHGSLSYVPNTADEPGFFFFPDTTHAVQHQRAAQLQHIRNQTRFPLARESRARGQDWRASLRHHRARGLQLDERVRRCRPCDPTRI